MLFVLLVAMLLVILVAAEIFTNALEHLGQRLHISEGITGSLFAAVATALPETMVPLLAIFAGTDNQTVNEEIGVGAILGAPLMLSTLALCLIALFSLGRRGLTGGFTPERSGIVRDLDFFLLAFGLATVALFVPHHLDALRALLGMGLVLTYFIYIMLTVRASARLVEDGHFTEADRTMYANRLGLPDNMTVIIAQIVFGLGLLIGGAKGFIHGVEEMAEVLGVSALLLSLIIVPIATELPEKVNSVLWIRRYRDTLSFGNVTGAMVFQGTLLPAIGIMLTPWEPRLEVFVSIIVTLLAAVWVRMLLVWGTLQVWHLVLNGLLYGAYLYVALAA